MPVRDMSQDKTNNMQYTPPPSLDTATLALADLTQILRPPRKTGNGYRDPQLDSVFRSRLEHMQQFLSAYVNIQSVTSNRWIAASVQVAISVQRKPWYARTIRKRTRAFINDREDLPYNIYGDWNESLLDKDESLAADIQIYLQSIGKFMKAMDIVNFLDTEMRARTGLKKRISLATAQQWMHKPEYRWTKDPKGQYVDGHERDDVVTYCQKVFLPAWRAIKDQLHCGNQRK